MAKLNIGITSRGDGGSIFSNGLDQNTYHLYNMLADMGYNPTLISESSEAKNLLDIQVRQIDIYLINKFDIILEVAHPLSDNLTRSFNSSGRPLIGIKYGNNFMMDLEGYTCKSSAMISSTGVNLPYRNREIWISEQFVKFKDYIEVLTRCKARVIPYIWDSAILRRFDGGFHQAPMDISKNDIKKIAIIEPNINIVKNCIIPLAICEMAYDKRKDLISDVYCFGSKSLDKNIVFTNYIKNLNIHKDRVVSYEARYPIFKIFKQNIANTIVSTQLFNEQNYAYLETLFYKRLLVHNSPMFKDVGVYYPEFDVNIASDLLIDSIGAFDQSKYKDSYESKLEDVSIYNHNNQEVLRSMIESVIK